MIFTNIIYTLYFLLWSFFRMILLTCIPISDIWSRTCAVHIWQHTWLHTHRHKDSQLAVVLLRHILHTKTLSREDDLLYPILCSLHTLVSEGQYFVSRLLHSKMATFCLWFCCRVVEWKFWYIYIKTPKTLLVCFSRCDLMLFERNTICMGFDFTSHGSTSIAEMLLGIHTCKKNCVRKIV